MRPEEKAILCALAENYGVSKLLLFGSAQDSTGEARDLDLAVAGLPPSELFRFYGDLILSLPYSVDLVDVSEETEMAKLIVDDGTLIYGRY